MIRISRSVAPPSGELAFGGGGRYCVRFSWEAPLPPWCREPVLGATVFRLAQTAPDGVRALVQAGGSPFDVAGRRPTGRIRMACKRSAVRARLAPLFFVRVFDKK